MRVNSLRHANPFEFGRRPISSEFKRESVVKRQAARTGIHQVSGLGDDLTADFLAIKSKSAKQKLS